MQMNRLEIFRPVAVMTAAIAQAACRSEAEQLKPPAGTKPEALVVHVLDDAMQLTSFSPSDPATLSAPVRITGLDLGEDVLGIDFRPGHAHLHALTTAGRLLTVDPATGATAFAGKLGTHAADTSATCARLDGTLLIVDVHPAADCLRAISQLSHSLCIDMETGAATTDAGRHGSPVAAGAIALDLYDIDSLENVLARQAPPDNGSPDMDADGAVGAGGWALAALRCASTGTFSLYRVSLATGVATLHGNASGAAARLPIGGAAGGVVRDIAIRG